MFSLRFPNLRAAQKYICPGGGPVGPAGGAELCMLPTNVRQKRASARVVPDTCVKGGGAGGASC